VREPRQPCAPPGGRACVDPRVAALPIEPHFAPTPQSHGREPTLGMSLAKTKTTSSSRSSGSAAGEIGSRNAADAARSTQPAIIIHLLGALTRRIPARWLFDFLGDGVVLGLPCSRPISSGVRALKAGLFLLRNSEWINPSPIEREEG
jgi:hypothetical protein